MRTKTMGTVLALLPAILALPAAAAPQDDGGPAGERRIEVVVVDGEGEAAEVLEKVLVDEPHRRVIRIAREFDGPGGPAAGNPPWAVFAPGGEGHFSSIEGRGYLGVSLVELTPQLRVHFGAGEETGMLVGEVDAGSPAALAGVRVGDVLTHVGGQPVEGHFDVLREVRPLTAGQTVVLDVVRDGRVETLSATIAERDLPRIEAHALLRRLGEEGDLEAWDIDAEELGRRMGEASAFFVSPEWREHVQSLTVTGEGLEERLEEMEREIERLSRYLEEQSRELEERNGEIRPLD